MALSKVIRISPYTLLRKERRLPLPGDVLVQPGAHVEATQVIAQATRFDWTCLDIARELGVKESDLELFLVRKPGDTVEVGEELAVKKGILPFTSYSYASPISGRVAATGMGQLIIETASQKIELTAGLRGTVKDLIPYYGAVLEGKGGLVEGLWSNGKEGTGILKILDEDRTKALLPEDLDEGSRGLILVCGHLGNPQALEKAAEMEVAGILAGSIHPDVRQQALSMPYPILMVEGFGELPLSSLIFELIRGYERQEASILQGDSLSPRPCLFIPVPMELVSTERVSPGVLRVGVKVRISRSPHRAKYGQIKDLPRYEVTLESGYTMPVARVQLEDGTEAEVPLANLELIDET